MIMREVRGLKCEDVYRIWRLVLLLEASSCADTAWIRDESLLVNRTELGTEKGP